MFFVFVSVSVPIFHVLYLWCVYLVWYGNLNSERYKIWPEQSCNQNMFVLYVSRVCVCVCLRLFDIYCFSTFRAQEKNIEAVTTTIRVRGAVGILKFCPWYYYCWCVCGLVPLCRCFYSFRIWPFVLLMLAHISVCNIIYVGLLAFRMLFVLHFPSNLFS